MDETELIPGLPDDVALSCLLRLPFHAFAAARRVCKRWRQEITSPSFYRFRKAGGHAHPLVAVIQRKPGWKNLTLFEPTTGVWTRLPPVPDCSSYWQVTPMGHELVVTCRRGPCGGAVIVYNLLTGERRLAATTMPIWQRTIFGPASSSEARMRIVHMNRLRSKMARMEWWPNMASRNYRRCCWGIFAKGAFFDDRGQLAGQRTEKIFKEGKWRKVALPAELSGHVEFMCDFEL